MPMIVPKRVDPDEEARELRITWRDGKRSVIPFRTLREHCPCARCRTTRDEGGTPLVFELSLRLTSWNRLGNYALNFVWGDSHQEGIFSYDLLRELTPLED